MFHVFQRPKNIPGNICKKKKKKRRKEKTGMKNKKKERKTMLKSIFVLRIKKKSHNISDLCFFNMLYHYL